MQAQSTMNRRNLRMREREVARIPIEAIRPNPYQPRRVFAQEALEELCASIKQYGLLQPISVRKAGNDAYELIAGERRLRACRMAGLTTIDAIVFSAYEQDSAVIAMMENLQRENLHYMEEAEGYRNMMEDYGLTQEELAAKLSKSQSSIANKLRILKLEDSVKKLLLEHHPAVQPDGAPRARPAPPARRGDANQDCERDRAAKPERQGHGRPRGEDALPDVRHRGGRTDKNRQDQRICARHAAVCELHQDRRPADVGCGPRAEI